MWLRVPPMRERRRLVQRIHEETGLGGGERLYQFMKCKYYWAGMRSLCLEIANTNLAR